MSQPARIFIITSANVQLMDRQLVLVWQQEVVILQVEGWGHERSHIELNW
jgi:hypothetical protein